MQTTHTRIVLAGMLSLATAMGIGRFAFTPLLPMMLHDGVVSLAGASWLASANYIGYLVGALFCTFKPLPRPTDMVSAWPCQYLGADPGHGATVARGLAAVALRGRRGQRTGVCLHLGLVPVAGGLARPHQRGRADPMEAEVHTLTEPDMAALANYLESFPD